MGDKEKNNGNEQVEKDEGERKKKVMKVLQCNSNRVFVRKVQEEFENFFPELVKHFNVKPIQAVEFQKDIADPRKHVVQLDYAMSYQCKWQDEVESALWNHCSVTLFTVAVNCLHCLQLLSERYCYHNLLLYF